jgi:hypothetical protein
MMMTKTEQKFLLILSGAKRSRRTQGDFASLHTHRASFDYAQDEEEFSRASSIFALAEAAA